MAWTALAVAGLWILLAIFAVDAGLELSVVQRVTVMALGLAALVWASRRFVAPWLGVRETEIDTALLVERQHGIDSDLVAALQFDGPVAETYGSRDLRAAVVTGIQELGPRLDVSRGMDYSPLWRRLKLFGVTLVAAVVIGLLFPRHLAVFFSRLALSERHYPSATIIQRIDVNGSRVWEWNGTTTQPEDTRAAQGRPVKFLVECRGEKPMRGEVECRSLLRRSSRELELRRLSPAELATLNRAVAERTSKAGGESMYYLAELPRMVEDFAYTLRLGDAWTDAAHIRMIEPPSIQLTVQVTPPAYASAESDSQLSPSHLAVLEGSRLSLSIRCLNEKRLKSATIQIDAAGVMSSYPLKAAATGGPIWEVPDDTPLANVRQELRYEVQVLDEDGLELESPLHGFVQLKVDRPPSAVASMVHRAVLPQATPIIDFRLSDDYGIAAAVLQGQVQRRQDEAPGTVTDSLTGSSSQDSAQNPTPNSTEPPDEKIDWKIPLDPSPIMGQNLPYRGKFAIPLSPLKLAKGDQLKLQISLTDHRGASAGKQAWSEPVVLEVSDEAGVLAAITETDERSEKRLSDVIKQQLGVGGKK